MTRTLRRIAWLLAVLGGAGGLRAQAADAVDAPPGTNSTTITSRHLDFDYPKRTAVFEGDVVVTDPRVTITSDSMTAVFATNNQPETITAVGNVRIEQEGRTALSSRATYSVKSGLLVLTGKPKVIRGTSVMMGSRIIFSRDDDKVTCEDATVTIGPTPGGLNTLMKKP